ncbi:baseplate hub protein [Pseudomonas phage MiCath]|uniref:Baseplate hub protein n=1 Tax=Pseudomonas phage MiCath TaxID=3003729 RepID=A0AAE9VDI4_9CAUD|nr:baseplate hub protein [Pseudomonas phage MiCath]WAX22449.1 baseplate hub protein [Pseudomonas phage MiCath]
MTAYFNRSYKLEIVTPLGENFVIQKHSNTEGIDTTLNISFDVVKDLTEIPNPGQFRLYNASPDVRTALETPETYIQFVCGYQDVTPLIFKGVIVAAWTEFNGVDIITNFDAMDGYLEWRDSVSTISLPAGTTAKAILDRAAKGMNLPIRYPANMPEHKFARGFAYYGAAREVLVRVCKAVGLSYSIQNSVIQINNLEWNPQNSGITFDAGSGLIGSPERMRNAAYQSARVKDEITGKKVSVKTAQNKVDGWRIQSYLRGELLPGDYFGVTSRVTEFKNGKTLKASKVRFVGEYDSDAWFTYAECDER